MTRTTKYRRFKKELRVIVRKMSAMQCNPFGKDAVDGYRRYEYKYSKLSAKWMDWVDERVHRNVARYYEPVIKGRNGRWYSHADMDQAMMGYGI